MEKGYAICFNEWALDKDIKSELGLLLIISSLSAEKGYCYASNDYLSNVFKIDQVSISRKIKKLEDKNYIIIEYEKRGSQIISRKIRLTKMLTDDYQKYQSTINKNVKENNININNTSINIQQQQTILEILEKNGFILTPIQYEEVLTWNDDELTRYAIKQAVLNNKFNVSYISKILYAYEKENIKTVGEAIEREENFMKERDDFYKNKYKRKETKAEERERKIKEWLEKDD